MFRKIENPLKHLVLLLALAPTVAMAQRQNCVPSCEADDSRLLVITDGAGLETLTDTTLELQIRSPGGGYTLSFFDGETSGPAGHWDLNSPGSAPQLNFNLYADADGDGIGDALLAFFDGESMADNAWVDFAVADDASAKSATGEYVYLLLAELTGTLNPGLRSVFKVAADADVLIEVFQQPFAFNAAMPGFKELAIIYPGCAPPATLAQCLASLAETTYDGDFRFFLTVQDPLEELVIWDGDLDRGDFDGNNPDGDDFNTLDGIAGLPPWACVDPLQPCDAVSNPPLASVAFEGIASGFAPSTGDPPDDRDASLGGGLGEILLRPGPISYEVWGPDARLLATNDDPSGNREWEMFRLAVPGTSSYLDANGLPPDVDVPNGLPAGIYEIRVKSLDLENLNAFRFGAPAVTEPNCEDGRPTGLTFIYTADSCGEPVASNNSQGGLPGTSGDYECAGPLATGDGRAVRLVPVKKPERFEMVPDTAFPGEMLTIRAMTNNGRLFPHTELEVQDAQTGEVLQEVTLHTSCSQPLIVGEQFGSLNLFAYFMKF
jgi:hypothetical protein